MITMWITFHCLARVRVRLWMRMMKRKDVEEGAGAGELLKVLDLASTAGCPEVEEYDKILHHQQPSHLLGV